MNQQSNQRERDLSDEVNAASGAVRLAAGICRAVQADLVNAETIEKKDKSPVTVADYASQAVICSQLVAVFPGDPIVAEEGTGELREATHERVRQLVAQRVGHGLGVDADEQQVLAWIDRGAAEPEEGERFWTLDPIDGTMGFLRGDHYAIALALIESGRVVLGVLGCPNLANPFCEEPGTLFVAVRGQGAAMLPLWEESRLEAISVSAVRDPAEACFVESVESAHSNQSDAARIAETLGIHTEPVRIDSQVKYAAVARGDASIYLRLPTRSDYQEKIWDHAAGSIIVEEAGGRVTDMTGAPLDFGQGRTFTESRGIVATGGRIHEAVIEAVRDLAGK